MRKLILVLCVSLLAIGAGCTAPDLDGTPDDGWTLQDGGTPDAGGGGGGGCKLPEPDKHRASPQTCDGNPPVRDVPDIDAGSYNECTSHDDCSGTNGRCVQSRGGYVCTHDECMTDSDCGDGQVCECGGGHLGSNTCLTAECQTDADCGPNGYCSPSFGSCGSYSGTIGYFCHTCEDECTDDSDCGGQDGYGAPYCKYDQQTGKWTCSNSHCVG